MKHIIFYSLVTIAFTFMVSSCSKDEIQLRSSMEEENKFSQIDLSTELIADDKVLSSEELTTIYNNYKLYDNKEKFAFLKSLHQKFYLNNKEDLKHLSFEDVNTKVDEIFQNLEKTSELANNKKSHDLEINQARRVFYQVCQGTDFDISLTIPHFVSGSGYVTCSGLSWNEDLDIDRISYFAAGNRCGYSFEFDSENINNDEITSSSNYVRIMLLIIYANSNPHAYGDIVPYVDPDNPDYVSPYLYVITIQKAIVDIYGTAFWQSKLYMK